MGIIGVIKAPLGREFLNVCFPENPLVFFMFLGVSKKPQVMCFLVRILHHEWLCSDWTS